MKRFVSLLTVMLISLALAGCGGDDPTPTPPPGGTTPTPDATPTEAAAVDFSGETITIIVGYGAGGTYDTNARLLSEHMPSYLPGNPTIIVENMPGGGGVLALNHLYGDVDPDGLTWASANPAVLNQVAGIEGFQVDFNNLPAVGTVTGRYNTCYVRSDTGIETLQDLIDSDTSYPMSATGAVQELQLDAIVDGLGANINVIPGYAGFSDTAIAIEQNEVIGNCLAWIGVVGGRPDWVEDGFIRPIFQITPDGENGPQLDVETLHDYEDQFNNPALFDAILASVAADKVLFSIFSAPGTPDNVMNVIQDAFWQTVNDPEFVAAVEATGRNVNPVRGDEVEQILRNTLQSITPEVEEILIPYITGE